MTSIADRLVDQGLVRRGSLETDRRAVSATITPAGKELIRTVEAERNADAHCHARRLDRLPTSASSPACSANCSTRCSNSGPMTANRQANRCRARTPTKPPTLYTSYPIVRPTRAKPSE